MPFYFFSDLQTSVGKYFGINMLKHVYGEKFEGGSLYPHCKCSGGFFFFFPFFYRVMSIMISRYYQWYKFEGMLSLSTLQVQWLFFIGMCLSWYPYIIRTIDDEIPDCFVRCCSWHLQITSTELNILFMVLLHCYFLGLWLLEETIQMVHFGD